MKRGNTPLAKALSCTCCNNRREPIAQPYRRDPFGASSGL